MSTREALIREIEKQPEPILREVHHYLDILIAQHREKNGLTSKVDRWPEGYFEMTAGAFANEPFERSGQLPFEKREKW